ncbi:hypothetical protein [Gimesia panareensis]|uniref:Uncharacterized protein n=1 Tax=Gimesia panareensis TaxID=2527978 RepID=A0A517QGE8_9PLAN|nr:hypothetical protein [Gimesia panareensis]QDT30704.1 hypothetical protein Enr10x_60720 [Gimesia panareensis]QDU53754.1 hypothetical protein Pan110_61480 [Gimesia panareensis]
MKVNPKIRFTVVICLLSLAIVILTWPGQDQRPLSPFADYPLWFLGGFLVQPAFCMALIQENYFDMIAILALLINAVLFSNVFYTVWKSQRPLLPLLSERYVVGLVINFGNFVLALMRSV